MARNVWDSIMENDYKWGRAIWKKTRKFSILKQSGGCAAIVPATVCAAVMMRMKAVRFGKRMGVVGVLEMGNLKKKISLDVDLLSDLSCL